MVRRPSTESDEPSHATQVKFENKKSIPHDEDSASQDEIIVGYSEGESQDEDSGVDEEEDGEDEQGSSRHNKRARHSENGQSSQRVRPNPSQRPQVVLERDERDGYVVGSIVRIKLYQFLTYEEAEFRPGPYLNMILGPNGTGKSSIACALCLGLNWPTKVLGRATRIGSFVKNDSNEPGFIEIELKGKIGGKNYVIRRLLSKSMERQEKFTLNDKEVSGSVIKELVEGLGIQVNNLCSFLPQDKVVEFSQMTPQQLLRATENAAGHRNLVAWHEFLIEEGKNLNTLVSELEAEKKELAQLEQRNTNLEKEVQAYRNRREIEQRIELFDLILPFKEYLDSRVVYTKLKAERKKTYERVLQFKSAREPVEQFRSVLEQKKQKAEADRNKYKVLAREKFASLKAVRDDNQKLQDGQSKVEAKLTALKREERERKARIEELTKIIHKMETEIANPPDIEDLSVIQADQAANDKKRIECERQKHRFEDEIKPYIEESERQNSIKAQALTRLKNLEDVSLRRLEALEKWDHNIGPVVRWLRQNKYRFRMDVIEPAILSVDLKDRRFAAAVESAFTVVQLKTFVFQCQEDYKLFSEIVLDSDQLGRRYRVPTWFRDPASCREVPPPIPPNELQSRGFDAYAFDCITFPNGMENFLKIEVNLHRFAIALDAQKVNVNDAMTAMTKIFEDGRGGSGNFVSGNVLMQVIRSRYGQRKAFSNTRDIQAARNLTSQAIPPDIRIQLENAVKQAEHLRDEAEAEIAKISRKIASLEQQLTGLVDERRKIELRKKTVIEQQTRIQTLQRNLVRYQRELTGLQNAPSAAEKRVALRQELFEIAKKRMNIAKELGKLIKATMKDHENATISGIQYLQQNANLERLEEKMRALNQDYEEAQRVYLEVNKAFEEIKEATSRKLQISKAKLEDIDEEHRQTFLKMESQGEIQKMDCELIRTELATLREQLELNMSTNAGVIEQYEKRQRLIENLQKKIESQEAKKARKERKVEKTRSKWYPALQSLVAGIREKFSAAFERVGCAGDVRLRENEDYAAWTIDILVKFRDTEQLQLLTGQRQSGGERALTTIMYLMSLTELARTPFSLVDEINQGMDQLYERAVHNSLVDVTCREQSGQYFLITPKLLTDLQYHKRMKVLCVNNGEWLPEELNSGSLQRMLKNYVTKSRR